MIDKLFMRFDEAMIRYIKEKNDNHRVIDDNDLNNVVDDFKEIEECTMNLVVAGRFSVGSEITCVIVINVLDEVNHEIVSRVSSLRFG